MRIRFWLYLFFGALSMLPIIFLGTWAQNKISAGPGEMAGNSMLLATVFSIAVAALVSILFSHLISEPMERMHAAAALGDAYERRTVEVAPPAICHPA